MKFRSFRHTFHDGHLASFALGPRRELTLEVALNPVWNKEGPTSASVRFGGIENYDEVASFFNSLPQSPQSDPFIAQFIGLDSVGDGPNWVVVDLVGHDHMQIRANHVTES